MQRGPDLIPAKTLDWNENVPAEMNVAYKTLWEVLLP